MSDASDDMEMYSGLIYEDDEYDEDLRLASQVEFLKTRLATTRIELARAIESVKALDTKFILEKNLSVLLTSRVEELENKIRDIWLEKQ